MPRVRDGHLQPRTRRRDIAQPPQHRRRVDEVLEHVEAEDRVEALAGQLVERLLDRRRDDAVQHAAGVLGLLGHDLHADDALGPRRAQIGADVAGSAADVERRAERARQRGDDVRPPILVVRRVLGARADVVRHRRGAYRPRASSARGG